MATRLILLRAGAAPTPIDLDARLTVGDGDLDRIRVPGLSARALVLSPATDGVLVEVHAGAAVVAGRALTAGARRLVRPGEALELVGATLRAEATPAPEGTRTLAGALLAAGVAHVAGPTLIALEGPLAGERLPLRDGAVVGRGRGADLRVPDPLLSRRHAVFALGGGAASVHDLGSKNGVSVNGRAAGRARVALQHGDAVELGGSVLAFDHGGAPAGSTPDGSASARAGREEPDLATRRRAAGALLMAGALALLAALLSAVI